MIIKEYFMTRKDGIKLYKSFSDQNVKIHKIGTDEIYDEAVDVENTSYKYEETNIPIKEEAE